MTESKREPTCKEHLTHDWQRPTWKRGGSIANRLMIGGAIENPGVTIDGDARIEMDCCANCGKYRSQTFRPQGADPMVYTAADADSAEWIFYKRNPNAGPVIR